MPGVITNDQLDFHYLVTKYGIDGARTHFESICVELMQRKYGSQAHGIRVSQGDGGIDVMVGDFSAPIQVYQCKFFLEKSTGVKNSDILDSSRRGQITSSFRTARKNTAFSMSKWSLCLPCVLSEREMEWWSEWKANMEEDFDISIELCDGDYLITELKKYGLYDQIFDVQLSNTLDELKRKMDALIAASSNPDNHLENVTRISSLIDRASIAEAQEKFTRIDTEKFYLVDTNFQLMLRVVCSNGDIVHNSINARLAEILASGAPAILTGNSGCGKSTIMLRSAVDWVRKGNMALWVQFSENSPITDGDAKDFYASLLKIIPEGQKALLCLDNPSEHTDGLRALAKHWPDDSRIQLMLSERTNRLSRLADPNCDYLHHWFSDAAVVAMVPDDKHAFKLNNYAIEYHPDTYQRKYAILAKAVPILIKKTEAYRSEKDTTQDIMRQYNKGYVGLVELLYCAQFYMKGAATKPNALRLDWDEWQRILKKELKTDEDAQELYGVIALCSVFGIPIHIDTFCAAFSFDRYSLIKAVTKWRMTKHIEPVIYRECSETLIPKHDVIAELFFRFHRYTLPFNELMIRILDLLDEYETENFLTSIQIKKAIQDGKRNSIYHVHYRDYLMHILNRMRKGICSLTIEGKTKLGLCLLYTVPKQDRSDQGREILRLLDSLDVSIAPDRLTASFYTEWGILAARRNNDKLAEEKFRDVIRADEKNVHSRTELGRLLMKLDRHEDAEAVLREIIQLKPNDIQSRTELGRLLMKLGRDEEAETVLREAFKIDPKHIQSRTELGRLLMKLGRHEDAETLLHEIIQINPNDIQSRTELGRLLMKLDRDKEAETVLRETLVIDPKHIHSRTELGRLLMKLGRNKEAETVLQQILAIDHDNIQARTELGRLLMKLDRHEDAEAVLREILAIDHDNIHTRTELGRLFMKLGRHEDAETVLRETFKIDPNHIQSRTELGRLLMKLDRYNEAKTVLREILAIDHDNIQARTELGRLLMKLGRHADAEDVLQTILHLDAKNLHARIQLAELRIRSDHFEQARELYQEVLRLDPGNPYATKGLAKLDNP